MSESPIDADSATTKLDGCIVYDQACHALIIFSIVTVFTFFHSLSDTNKGGKNHFVLFSTAGRVLPLNAEVEALHSHSVASIRWKNMEL